MSDDIHALAGAYALDALDDIERARFEQHLSRCDTCQADVAGYRAAATRLATAVAQPPSPALRDRVLGAIDDVRQEPPAVRAITERRRLVRTIAAAAAAVVLVLAGIEVFQARGDRDRAEEFSTIVTAPDAARIDLAATADGPAAARGSVVWSAEEGKSVVTLDGLPRLDDDRAYAVWFIVGGKPQSAGLLSGEGERIVATIDAPPADVEAMGVTNEPAGGSDAPTTPVLLLGNA